MENDDAILENVDAILENDDTIFYRPSYVLKSTSPKIGQAGKISIYVTLAYRIGDKSEIRFLRERPSMTMFKMIKLTIFVFLHKSTLQHLIYSYSITIYTNVPQMSPFMTL